MRLIAAAVLVIALLGISFVTTALSVLHDFTGAPADVGEVSLDAIISGQAHQVLWMPVFWRKYPAIPKLSAMVHIPVFLAIGVFTIGAVCLIRTRFKQPWLLVGLACLLSSPFCYGAGMLALHNNTNDPELCGPWLQLMYVGLLYPLAATSAFAAVELLSSRLTRVSATQETLAAV